MQTSELSFERDGAEIISGAVSDSTLRAVAGIFDSSVGARPGARSVAAEPAIRSIVDPGGAMGQAAQRFARQADSVMRPVRVVLFDKTPGANWAVAWHQDRTIAVTARHDMAGFDHWNVKAGVAHVEPPIALLSRMVTLRLHLDDTGADNGALWIVPGSHTKGRVLESDLAPLVAQSEAVCCRAGPGDILAMRLTTVHKSDRALSPSRRRVLHVDYSADRLPMPLAWAI